MYFIYLMFSLRLTARDNASKHKINKYGEMGSPCLHPSSHLKRSERYPKFKLALELSLQNNLSTYVKNAKS